MMRAADVVRSAAVAALLALAACGAPPSGDKAPKTVSKIAEAPVAAPVAPQKVLCKADRRLACSGAGCEGSADDYMQIELTFDAANGTGRLCQAGACAGVTVLGPSGDKLSGVLLVGAAGEAGPSANQTISIAPDLKTFAIMGAGGGRFVGYGGACAPAA